ncbi:MAG: hypothetical protein ACREJQ_01295, partial [bacterium]
SALISTITYEINTSLTGIVANATVLSDFMRDLPDSATDPCSKERSNLLERLQHILDCADRVTSVVTRLNKLQESARKAVTGEGSLMDLEGGPGEL